MVYDVQDPCEFELLKCYGSEKALFLRDCLLVSGRGAGIGECVCRPDSRGTPAA